jgi:hypothetical protein
MKRISLPIMALILLSSFGFLALPLIQNAAALPPVIIDTQTNATNSPVVITITFTHADAVAGNFLVIGAGFRTVSGAGPGYTIADSYGNTFTVATNQGYSSAEEVGYFTKSIGGAGTDTITFTDICGGCSYTDFIGIVGWAIQGLPANATVGAYKVNQACSPTCSLPLATPALTFPVTHNYLAFGLGYGIDTAGTCTLTHGTGFTGAGSLNGGFEDCMQGEYSTTVGSGTTFPQTLSRLDDGWLAIGFVMFGNSAVPSTFTSTITNLDCGNCVIAGNSKFYDFHEVLTSNAVDPVDYNFNFSVVSLQFNDSLHTVTTYYFFGNGSTILAPNSGGIVTLAATKASVAYNNVTQVYTATVDFYITFNNNVLQVANRGTYLQGCLNEDGLYHCTAYLVENHFDILNVGGLTNTVATGGCSHIAGGDAFSDTCHYTASPVASIMTNSTWIDLQSYSTQFSYTTNNTYVWQQYQGGANPSSNHKDWTQTLGFFYYDGTTWVKGPSVVISMLMGNEGGNNEWTLLNTVYYFGSTLISNQTISVWIGQATVASPPTTGFNAVGVFVDIWYTSINASTTWGARTNAYYVGMHNTGTLFSNWNPLYGNQSTSQAFGTLKDHTGKILSSTQIQCTKVFSIFNRLGAPGVHTKQPNFVINTIAFNVQQFNFAASPDQMGGVNTPVYTQPLVPIISSSSNFLAPLYAAIAGIAGFFVKSLVALGGTIFAGIAARFPFFTVFYSTASQLIGQFFLLFVIVTVYLIEALAFMVSIISYVTIPITMVVSAWTTISGIYNVAFKGVPLPQVIELFIIVVFGLSVFEALMTGDFPYIIRLTRGAWSIVHAVMVYTYLLVKFFVDFVEGLIP